MLYIKNELKNNINLCFSYAVVKFMYNVRYSSPHSIVQGIASHRFESTQCGAEYTVHRATVKQLREKHWN
jgi:hypothetical protein